MARRKPTKVRRPRERQIAKTRKKEDENQKIQNQKGMC